MGVNLGDLARSAKMAGRSEVVVAEPITAKERDCDGLQEVGGAHSTCESGDSITPDEGRGSAHLHGHTDAMKNSIPLGVRGS